MMDEGIVKGGDENDELMIAEVDSAIVEAVRETALVEIDAGKTEIATIMDAAEKLAPEIVKWKERGEMVRLDMPLGFRKEDLLKGRGYAKKLAVQGKDGKFVATASIKELGKAGALANVFGIASYVVGQQQMAEMNKRLESIETSLNQIMDYLDRRRKAQIRGKYRALKQYMERLDECLENQEQLPAVRGEVERIRNESLDMWEELLDEIRAFDDALALDNNPGDKKKPKRLDRAAVNKQMDRLALLEQRAAAIMEITCLSSQIKARFDPEYAEQTLESGVAGILEMYEEYAPERQRAILELGKTVTRVKGAVPIAIAADREYSEFHSDLAPVEKVVGAAQALGRKTGKVNPARMLETKKENDEELRRLLASNVASLEADDKPKAAADGFKGDVYGEQGAFFLLYDWDSEKVYMVPRDGDGSDGDEGDVEVAL